MVIKQADELRILTSEILLKTGSSSSNARQVAEHLVLANLKGIDTHGIWHIPGYVSDIQTKKLLPAGTPSILKETAATALVSGNWTFGQVAAKFAIELAIKKAKKNQLALVGLVQAHHLGRVGHFSELAAKEKMISMTWLGGFSEIDPKTVPFGGRKRLLHTNPIAMGVPSGNEPPMIIDFATSAISGVKVDNAYNRNQSLPEGCIVDNEGKPSTNPADFFNGGGHIPFGQHKGWAIMLWTEFLSRIFLGSDSFVNDTLSSDVLRHHAATFLVFRSDLFQSVDEFNERADEMQQRVRAVPPAPGFKTVQVPGDPERKTYADRSKNGIPIEDDIWMKVTETAKKLGVNTV